MSLIDEQIVYGSISMRGVVISFTQVDDWPQALQPDSYPAGWESGLISIA